MVYNHKPLEERRRELRNNPTPQEVVLWKYLRRSNLGYKFRRQQGVDSYIVDFFCKEKRLIIEIDGYQHTENKEYDAERTKNLNQLGYTVMRFWNNEIDKNLNEVLNNISTYLTTP
jgi:very-short-patch-repair endonuclease